jgi:molybdopterin-guanine dinucleotide biosynthesis protein A
MATGSDRVTEAVAGVLLTGGASRRMGRDKATMEVEGTALAGRVAAALAEVASPCLEVGSGVSGLPSVLIDTARQGPLVAVATAAKWLLDQRSSARHVLTLACDLPLVTPAVLRWLLEYPSDRSILPVVGGRTQPLCARWTRSDLELAVAAVGQGATAMRALVDLASPDRVHPAEWAHVAAGDAFDDVDTPADWQRLVVQRPPGAFAVTVT